MNNRGLPLDLLRPRVLLEPPLISAHREVPISQFVLSLRELPLVQDVIEGCDVLPHQPDVVEDEVEGHAEWEAKKGG